MRPNKIYRTLFVLSAFLLCSTKMQAQEPYAVLSDDNTVLTFYYDGNKASRNGMDVGPFDWVKVDDNWVLNSGWYQHREAITTVVFDNTFANCTSFTSTAYWFYHCYNLSTITGIESLKTDNVTNMYGMFYGCSSLTSLNVSGFKTDNVTNMYDMFGDCHGLKSLDVSGFNTDNVTDMACMFENCSGLTSLDLSGFKTNNVTNMCGMFFNCFSLTSLDLSNFKTDNVIRIHEMFEWCNGLTTIYVGDGWSMNKVTDGVDMFTGCTNLVGGKGTVYDADYTDYTYAHIDGGVGNPGYFTAKETSSYTIDATNFPDENFRNYLLSQDYGQDGVLTQEEIERVTEIDVIEKNIQSLKGIEFFTALTWLRCESNQLTSLDVSKNTALTYLNCGVNELASLDVSKNTALTHLLCGHNQLTMLDVSNNTALTHLECHKNQIDEAAMDALIASLPSVELGGFYAKADYDWRENNVITPAQVAVANAKGWTVYQYDINSYTWVEMEGEKPVSDIVIDATNFPDENFRNYLLSQDYGQDGVLTQEEIAGITYMDVSEREISDLTGIKYFTALEFLVCSYNQLTSLDMSGCTALIYLGCYQNHLTSLDVTGCTALTTLFCWNNQLTSLDVSGCTALTWLSSENNQLTSLDVSGCTALTKLQCNSNKIKGEMMDALVSSLPTVEAGEFYVLWWESDGNECTTAQVITANAKGWKAYQYDSSIGDWVEMEGENNGMCPDGNHPHIIDLGLPSGTQWRCCNEGASTPEAYGGYYQFGEISTAPTLEQINELLNYCTSVSTQQNDVNGCKFTGPNGRSIFLPAAGVIQYGGLLDDGLYGNYWSSTPDDESNAYNLEFYYSGNAYLDNDNLRNYGLSVRPVVYDEPIVNENIPTAGLVAYYPFNGNANDESGHGNHATPCNNYQFEDGIVGGCITVEGQGYMESSGGHVLLPQLDFDASSGVTLSLWVKAMNTIDSEAEVYIGFGDHTAHDQLYIYQDPNSSLVSFEYHESRIEVPYLENYTGKWVMYTLTCGADGKLKAYVNGAIAGEEDVDYDGQINTSYAALGRHWWYYGDATSTRFIGSFDEVCIYNRALTADEVRQMAQFAEKDGGAIPDEAIDLGLPSGTKWAPWNVGASKPEDYGGYYAWGETEEKDVYDWSTYIHCDGSEENCHDIGSDIAGTQYDVAHVKWGGSWQMPTIDQMKELLDYCESEWTTMNGVNGHRFTGLNGNSIFIPAAGYHFISLLDYEGSGGCFWSSLPSDYNSSEAKVLYFYSGGEGWSSGYPRHYGLSVRPVLVSSGNTNPEPYAVLSDDNTVLTFYYDGNKASRNGMDVGSFYWVEANGNWVINSGWYDCRESITTVVFDGSFANCTSLTSTAYWFIDCNNLTTITGIENLKTDNVTSMQCMFQICSSLTSLDVSGFKTDNVTDMSNMFGGCSGLTSLDVSGFKTDNVTDMGQMFYGCSSLTSLDVSAFKTDNVTNMYGLFYDCSGLTSLDVSGFKTDNVTNMYGLFYDCSGLTSLDVSGFKTDNVTYMSCMFYDCSGLTSLDVSGFKTDNVTDMAFMFRGCSGLTSLDVSGFKTDNVTDMWAMFACCSSLTSLDLSGFKTDNVMEMNYMFSDCSALTSLDLSSFKTDNVTSMGYMFEGCSSLTNLDLSGFKTDNVTNMGGMFNGCSSLTTIYAGDGWSTENVSYAEEMFTGSTSLVGGKGTVYDENHTDHTYARIDGGVAAPGYFTAKEADTDISQLDNVIYIEQTEALVGSETTLSIKMKNTAQIRGFQFDMYLPEGVTVAQDNKGRLAASLNTSRLEDGDDHTLTVGRMADGSYRFLCGSIYEETFTGNDGEIISLTLDVDDDMEEGDYPLVLKNVKLTENDISKKYLTDEVRSTLTIIDYTLGDINGDGAVDVSDYIGIANYILGNTPVGFNERAADVNQDGSIDVSDYIGVANIILTGSIYGTQHQSRISRHGYME